MESFALKAACGGSLHCCRWKPEGDAKGIVQIIHGIAEHIERYDTFARFLAENGYLVVGEDHMGHGGSVGEDGVKGYFIGGWKNAVADVHALHTATEKENPGLPYFMFGHSMGSFLLRTYLYAHPGSISGAVLSGTGWEPVFKLTAGIMLCRAKCLGGETAVSPQITKLLFSGYCKKITPLRTQFDWLCSVDRVVDDYIADPLCGFDVTVGLARDMLTAMRENQKQKNLDKMTKATPVLFLSGAEDPVGGWGRGVERCVHAFEASGMQHVSCKLYPNGRHEILNEANKDEVFSDVLSWLERNG